MEGWVFSSPVQKLFLQYKHSSTFVPRDGVPQRPHSFESRGFLTVLSKRNNHFKTSTIRTESMFPQQRKIAAGRGRLCSRLEIDCMCTSHAMNAAELASCAQQLSRTSRCVYVPVYLAAVPCRVVALTTPGLLARVARRRGWWRPQSSR